MKIFLLFSVITIAILLIGRRFIYSAKINLFKDQAAWSGKDIKIKRVRSSEVKENKGNNNYLKMVSDESKNYLEDQSHKEGDESK